MDSTKILSLLEQLDDEVDDLQESLEPLLKTALSETSSKLPLLDKAKLYVLVTYAIESVLFCKLDYSSPSYNSNCNSSVSATQWRQCARASCLYRTHPGKAVFREDQENRIPTREEGEGDESRQKGSGQIHHRELGQGLLFSLYCSRLTDCC